MVSSAALFNQAVSSASSFIFVSSDNASFVKNQRAIHANSILMIMTCFVYVSKFSFPSDNELKYRVPSRAMVGEKIDRKKLDCL